MRYLSEMFWSIPGMFLHDFQIVTNFLYVCQSVSWLTSLLKLYKYRDNSSYRWDIFLKFFGYIPGMLAHQFRINLNFLYVWQSLSWLTSLLIQAKIEISPVLDEISFWNLLEILLGYLYTYSKYIWNSCMNGSLLGGLLPQEIRAI